ncbi:MAG: hypothetical protein R2683_01350 [Bifidobacterium adolescentis]
MTQETESLVASTRIDQTVRRQADAISAKSKSLPKFTGEAMRACAKIDRIFFDDPDEAYRLF